MPRPVAREAVVCGDALELLGALPTRSIDLVVTSPPYAQQRQAQYGGIPEGAYPGWTVGWADPLLTRLKRKGSLAIVIRPHINGGQLSDYVLKTRLALRGAGWNEAEELVWIKVTSPPLGSPQRPKRAWESILWFSLASQPYCNPLANGRASRYVGIDRHIKGAGSYISKTCRNSRYVHGVAKCLDYVEVGCHENLTSACWNYHPAQYPVPLVKWIIKLLCPPGGMVVDPFCGSGTTLVACKQLTAEGHGLRCLGIDKDPGYCGIARRRLKEGR